MIVRNGACAALALFACTASTYAQQPASSYPSKSIRLVVGIPPGGGVDTVARAVAPRLAERLGAPSVVVDNRTGAGGAIAMEVVAQAAPDGYTLLAGSIVTVASATPLKKVAFDTRKAYAPVVQLNSQPYVLAVHPSLPAVSVKELIAYAKGRPGQLNYASTGIGSTSHLGMELFMSVAGIEMTHVPYRGLGPAMVEVAGGQIQVVFGAAIIVTPNARSGRLRALAVGSARRSRTLPDLPTIAESGLPGFEWSNSYAVFAPAVTPPVIVSRLNRELSEIVNLPDVRTRLAADGVEPSPPNSPAEFAKLFANEVTKVEKLLKSSSIKLQI